MWSRVRALSEATCVVTVHPLDEMVELAVQLAERCCGEYPGLFQRLLAGATGCAKRFGAIIMSCIGYIPNCLIDSISGNAKVVSKSLQCMCRVCLVAGSCPALLKRNRQPGTEPLQLNSDLVPRCVEFIVF